VHEFLILCVSTKPMTVQLQQFGGYQRSTGTISPCCGKTLHVSLKIPLSFLSDPMVFPEQRSSGSREVERFGNAFNHPPLPAALRPSKLRQLDSRRLLEPVLHFDWLQVAAAYSPSSWEFFLAKFQCYKKFFDFFDFLVLCVCTIGSLL